MDNMVLRGVLLLVVVVVGCSEAAQTPLPSLSREAPTANITSQGGGAVSATVGFKLYCSVASGKNFVFSPLGVATGLSLLYLGSRGETALELGGVLGLTGNPSNVSVHMPIGELSVQPIDSSALHSANNLFVKESTAFRQDFLASALTAYGVTPSPMNFTTEPEKSRIEINTWVAQNTMGKIVDLIPTGSLNGATQMVLVNAVYFSSDWVAAFPIALTHPWDFTMEDGQKVRVEMMLREGPFNHGFISQLNAQVLELPYTGNQFSMFIILPNPGSSLTSLRAQLCGWTRNGEQLLKIITAQMVKRTVDVFLPKFTLDTELTLDAVLSSLGINSIFDQSRSDLSGIDGTRNLYVSSALHKAHMEVDESGTTAAAASALKITLRSLPLQFRADRPFAFFILENRSKAIIFQGHIHAPNAYRG